MTAAAIRTLDVSSFSAGLSRGEIHVRQAFLDRGAAETERLARALSPDEKERAARFRFELHRKRFAAGRGLLRVLLGSLLDVGPERVEFVYGPNGKPGLSPVHRSLIRFSASHSNGLFLCAFTAGRDVGMDVEFLLAPSLNAGALAGQCLSSGERAAFRSLLDGEKSKALLQAWTAKEALLKAGGEGLSRPPADIELSMKSGALPILEKIGGDPRRAVEWSLQTFEPLPGYTASLAVRGPRAVVVRGWLEGISE